MDSSRPEAPHAAARRLVGLMRRALARWPVVYRSARRVKVVGRYVLRRPHEQDFAAIPHLGLNGRLFLDVGANSGQSALSFRIFDRRCPILSIEANPNLEPDLRLVERLVRNFSFIMCAAGASDGPVELSIPTFRGIDISGEASLMPDVDTEPGWWARQHLGGDTDQLSVRTITVPGMRLDTLNVAPGLIKIDVEGAASLVVDGLWQTITRFRPAIMVEADSDAAALTERLAALGYEARCWDGATGALVPVHPEAGTVFFVIPPASE